MRNEGAVPPIANAHPFVAVRDEAAGTSCAALAGYEIGADGRRSCRSCTRTKKEYQAKVAQRLDELTQQGWSLPVYRDVILADAAAVTF